MPEFVRRRVGPWFGIVRQKLLAALASVQPISVGFASTDSNKTRAFRANVADAQHEIASELALHFETNRVVDRHVEISVDDGPIHRVGIERRILQTP